MRTILLTVFLAASVVTSPVLAPGPAAAATACADLEIQAHRGYHTGKIDENTVASFDGAAARGYAIETDVWSDAEGQLWIFHDRDVTRATGADGYIDQMTTAQVAALRYRKAGSPLSTFDQAVADWTQYPSSRIYVEPKQREIIPAMVDRLRAAGVVDNVYFTQSTTYVDRTFPDFKTAPKASGTTTVADPSWWVDQGASAVMFGQEQMDATTVADYHAAGLEVHQRTSKTTMEWRRAITKDFDAIMTDLPDKLKTFCPVALVLPTVTSFSPTSGPVGTQVTITGANFYDISRVTVGGVTASFTVSSTTQITVTVPAGAPASSTIRMKNPNGVTPPSAAFHVTP